MMSGVLLSAVDECDRGLNLQAGDAPTLRVTSSNNTNNTTAAAIGHHVISLHDEPSSLVNNRTASWTSAEVMNWLERSRLQHLSDWYINVPVSTEE